MNISKWLVDTHIIEFSWPPRPSTPWDAILLFLAEIFELVCHHHGLEVLPQAEGRVLAGGAEVDDAGVPHLHVDQHQSDLPPVLALCSHGGRCGCGEFFIFRMWRIREFNYLFLARPAKKSIMFRRRRYENAINCVLKLIAWFVLYYCIWKTMK